MADLEELEDLDALDIEEMDADDDESSQLYEHYRIVADAKQGLMRVDKFLIDHLANISRNRIQKAADAGSIMCNERPINRSYIYTATLSSLRKYRSISSMRIAT